MSKIEIGCKECKKVYDLDKLPEIDVIENKKRIKSGVAVSKVVLKKL